MDDVTTPEHSTAEFCVELNDEDFTVTWLINGTEITPNEKYEITKEGKLHKLLIKDASQKDQGQVTANVGEVSTQANLVVEGKFFFRGYVCYSNITLSCILFTESHFYSFICVVSA